MPLRVLGVRVGSEWGCDTSKGRGSETRVGRFPGRYGQDGDPTSTSVGSVLCRDTPDTAPGTDDPPSTELPPHPKPRKQTVLRSSGRRR